jgi:hypothetical protein
MISGKGAGVQSLLHPTEGIGAIFFPISTASTGPSAYQNVNTRVAELVIPSSSPYCPDVSLRNSDGHFHTGDLFLEVVPGAYAFRGRVHDWLVGENGQSFDAKWVSSQSSRNYSLPLFQGHRTECTTYLWRVYHRMRRRWKWQTVTGYASRIHWCMGSRLD